MMRLTALAHTPEAIVHHTASVMRHGSDAAAQDLQRGRLRETSIIDSKRVVYKKRSSSRSPDHPAAKKARVDAESVHEPDRLSALSLRLAAPHPTRFAVSDWEEYRDESIDVLQPLYPETPLAELYAWLKGSSHPKGRQRLSTSKILEETRVLFRRTEIATVKEMRDVMRVLSFRWATLHSGYYKRISLRPDVLSHLKVFTSFALLYFESPSVYLVSADSSFLYENNSPREAWCPLAEVDGDLVDSNAGKGVRFNVFQAIDRFGLLLHPDGKDAGTIFEDGATQDRNDIQVAVRRICEAMAAKNLGPGVKARVLLIDGAKTQKTMAPDAIDPNDMNLSDGGKNRTAMRLIGTQGLRRVLEENDMWPTGGLSLKAARKLLWRWHEVRNQLTELEMICREYGITLAYNPKAHPWINWIERFWRLVKYETQNLFNVAAIRQRYLELVEEYTRGSDNSRKSCNKWHSLSQKYVQYYARGKTDFRREWEMKHLDLEGLGPRSIRPARLLPLDAHPDALHKCNSILLQGKYYDENEKTW